MDLKQLRFRNVSISASLGQAGQMGGLDDYTLQVQGWGFDDYTLQVQGWGIDDYTLQVQG